MTEENINSEPDIKSLIEKNVELSNEILRLSKKTNSILRWQSALGFIKIIIILIPLILGFLYLPPLLDDFVKTYKNALGIGEAVNSVDLEKIKNSSGSILKGITN